MLRSGNKENKTTRLLKILRTKLYNEEVAQCDLRVIVWDLSELSETGLTTGDKPMLFPSLKMGKRKIPGICKSVNLTLIPRKILAWIKWTVCEHFQNNGIFPRTNVQLWVLTYTSFQAEADGHLLGKLQSMFPLNFFFTTWSLMVAATIWHAKQWYHHCYVGEAETGKRTQTMLPLHDSACPLRTQLPPTMQSLHLMLAATLPYSHGAPQPFSAAQGFYYSCMTTLQCSLKGRLVELLALIRDMD